jgi:predicted patatin/cPLA2 family phospholipase
MVMTGDRLAIVASGGGMMCAYSAGVLQALTEHFRISPDFVIGTSGSSGNLAYFAAGQSHLLRSFWLNYAASENFISGTKVNISYMVDEVISGQLPLDIEALQASETQFFVSATEVESGEPCYFSSNDRDIKDALRASASMPLLAPPVNIRGKFYVDGAIGSPIWRTVEEAVERGATKIIVIDNSHREKLLMHILAWRFPKSLRRALYNSYSDQRINVPDHVEVIRLTPRRPLPLGVFTTDKKRVAQAMHIGYEDVLHNAQLHAMITPSYTLAHSAPLSSSLSSPQ